MYVDLKEGYMGSEDSPIEKDSVVAVEGPNRKEKEVTVIGP